MKKALEKKSLFILYLLYPRHFRLFPCYKEGYSMTEQELIELLEETKSVIMLIQHDLSNPDGAISDHYTIKALELVLKSLDKATKSLL